MVNNQSNVFDKYVKNIICGGFGGTCLVITGHPLDTIKVSLQTMKKVDGKFPYNGVLDCAKKIIKKEGPSGFYKGMGAPILGITPIYAATFLGYTIGKALQQNNDDNLTVLEKFNAGFLAGFLASAIAAPVERVKCLLQVQKLTENSKEKNISFKGPKDCIRQLYKQGGTRSIFRGYFITVLRDSPNTGIYFASYEVLSDYFSNLNNTNNEKKLNPTATLLAGGLSGMLFWIFAIPFDVIKSRMQSVAQVDYKERSSYKIFINLIKKEGITKLYQGSAPVFLRAFPANSACFFGYEACMSFLNWLKP